MMIIQITFEMAPDDPWADPEHEMGVTNEAYGRIVDALPGYDLNVTRVD